MGAENINFLLDGVNEQNMDRGWKDHLHYIYGKDAYFKAGTGFHYSNTNYILLGKVIEGVCNETHSQIIQKNIILSLQLNCTYYDPDATIPPQMVRGYMDFHNDGKITDITNIHIHTKLYSDAGVITNVYDLMLFCEALFTGKLLADTTLNKMEEWIPTNDEEMAGLGLFSSRTDFYGQCIGHTGYTFGFLSRLFYFPEKKIIFVLMANGSLGSISEHVTAFTKTSNNTQNEIFDAIFILPVGFMKIRQYGFLSNKVKQKKLTIIRENIQASMDTTILLSKLDKSIKAISIKEPLLCPHCNKGALVKTNKVLPVHNYYAT